MKTKQIYITLVLVPLVAISCNSQQAGEQKFSSKKQTASEDQTQGNTDPLDISVGFDAASARNADGSPVDPDADLPSKGTGDKLDQSFALTCDDIDGMIIDIKPKGAEPAGGSNKAADKTLSTTGDPEITATVSGKFCPVNKDSARKVMFVVDYSGSMGYSALGNQASDPESNGSCNRLRVAQAVYNNLSGFTNVEFSMVPFGGRVFTDSLVNFENKTNFKSKLTAAYFCQSKNPATEDQDAYTNYEAAFKKAQEMLSDVKGEKTIYFISDGAPTVSNSGGEEAAAKDGIAAGSALRDGVKNLTLNALLLGDIGAEAKKILVDVAGSDKRVREARLAEELAEKLEDLPDVKLDKSSASATLLADPYGTHKLDLNKFEESGGEWNWTTRPFVLLGTEGKVVENIVEVKASGNNGESFQSKIVIRYQR